MDPKQGAKTLLTHYFELTSGGTWNFNGDNQAEIEEIVNLIVKAATREMREEIERLEARINNLETSNLKRLNGEIDY